MPRRPSLSPRGAAANSNPARNPAWVFAYVTNRTMSSIPTPKNASATAASKLVVDRYANRGVAARLTTRIARNAGPKCLRASACHTSCTVIPAAIEPATPSPSAPPGMTMASRLVSGGYSD
jgi:hypothetical protein